MTERKANKSPSLPRQEFQKKANNRLENKSRGVSRQGRGVTLPPPNKGMVMRSYSGLIGAAIIIEIGLLVLAILIKHGRIK